MGKSKNPRKNKKKKPNKHHQKLKINASPDEALKALLKNEKVLEILDTQSGIIKWEQLTDGIEYKLPYKAGEKQGFKLLPYHPTYKALFEITGIYHVTCIDTDFILDTEIKSVVQLETNGVTPKAKQLYDVYEKTRPYWIGLILQESINKGYTLSLLDMPQTPFEILKPLLDEVIYRSIE